MWWRRRNKALNAASASSLTLPRIFISITSCGGPESRYIARRWRARQTAILSIELGWAFVANSKSRRRRIHSLNRQIEAKTRWDDDAKYWQNMVARGRSRNHRRQSFQSCSHSSHLLIRQGIPRNSCLFLSFLIGATMEPIKTVQICLPSLSQVDSAEKTRYSHDQRHWSAKRHRQSCRVGPKVTTTRRYVAVHLT